MADFFSINVDHRELFAAFDRVGDLAEKYVRAAASVTAVAIATEARRRVARRTGRTARAITAEPSRDGTGYVVYVKTPPEDWPNLDIGLEFGTRKMTARPFLLASAQLEEGPHLRRIEQALRDAIDEAGLT